MWDQIGQDLRKEHYRLALRPCEGCPLYSLPTLHPLTSLAIRVDQMLDGSAIGAEMYRLSNFEMSEDEYEMIFVPMLTEWRAIIAERKAVAQKKAAAASEQGPNAVDGTGEDF